MQCISFCCSLHISTCAFLRQEQTDKSNFTKFWLIGKGRSHTVLIAYGFFTWLWNMFSKFRMLLDTFNLNIKIFPLFNFFHWRAVFGQFFCDAHMEMSKTSKIEFNIRVFSMILINWQITLFCGILVPKYVPQTKGFVQYYQSPGSIAMCMFVCWKLWEVQQKSKFLLMLSVPKLSLLPLNRTLLTFFWKRFWQMLLQVTLPVISFLPSSMFPERWSSSRALKHVRSPSAWNSVSFTKQDWGAVMEHIW